MKETQRMNPLGLSKSWHLTSSAQSTNSQPVGIMRMSTSDVTLSDGSTIPRSSQFAFAMNSMYRDELVWENANSFDACRFRKYREQASDASESNKWQFIASKSVCEQKVKVSSLLTRKTAIRATASATDLMPVPVATSQQWN